MSSPTPYDGHAELAEFGYKQKLDRSLGSFSSFAAGFSYLSVSTGFFYLLYFGHSTAGPAFWWVIAIGGLLTMLIALNFAELVAHYPVAGSVYNWAKRVTSWPVAWLTGWALLVASIVTVAGVALAMQVILPQIWSGFQIIGDGSGAHDFAENAVLLGSILLVITSIINAVGVKIMAVINNVGVIVELASVAVLIVLLAVHIKRGPGVLTHTNGTGTGHSAGWLGAALVSALFLGYFLIGFDTAGSLAEETNNPREHAPRAILRAVLAALVAMLLLIGVGYMSVGNPKAADLGTIGGPYIVKSVLGNGLGDAFLACAAFAIFVCALAVQAACIRMIFAMARDGGLPFGRALAHIDARSRTPVLPAVVTGVIAIAILVINIQQTQIITSITSISVILFYVSYLLLTVPLLMRRLKGWPNKGATNPAGLFKLGRWGVVVNAGAVIYQIALVIDIAWPRAAVYNALPPAHWYLKWAGVVFPALFIIIGLVYFFATQRGGVRIRDEHKAVALGNAEPEHHKHGTASHSEPITPATPA